MDQQRTLAEHCEANVLNIPKALFEMRDVKPILFQGESSIFYKDLERDLANIEFHTRTPCIVYIKTGKEVITTCHDERFEVGPGEAIFLPQGLNLHSDYIHEGDGLKAYLSFFDSDIVTRFLASEPIPSSSGSNEEAIFMLGSNSLFENYFRSLHSVYYALKNSATLLQLKLLELLHLIDIQDDGALRKCLLSAQRGRTRRNIRRLMDQYAISGLTTSELAALSGRSLSTFNREFKTLYGVTPKQWLIDQRLTHAHTLLSQNRWSVTDTAIEAGYNNISHFIEAFKKKYGKTPHQIKIKINS
jgi:AraC family transcriptional regulator, exoenzyme S synthesis regulatory protein ExsA